MLVSLAVETVVGAEEEELAIAAEEGSSEILSTAPAPAAASEVDRPPLSVLTPTVLAVATVSSEFLVFEADEFWPPLATALLPGAAVEGASSLVAAVVALAVAPEVAAAGSVTPQLSGTVMLAISFRNPFSLSR